MTDQAERLRGLVQQKIQSQAGPAEADADESDILEERKRELTEQTIEKPQDIDVRPPPAAEAMAEPKQAQARIQTKENPQLSARVIAVSSGKGGVGKTNVSINLAISMRKQNKRVVLLDTDFGLANVEVLFGVSPKYNFGDVLAGIITVEAAMTVGPMGVQFLSGGSGLTVLSDITEQQTAVLINSFEFLDGIADVIIIDTGAGLSRAVVNFVKAAQEAVIVTTPDPTSITDAYALIKTVREACGGVDMPEFKLIVNRVESPAEGADIYEKLGSVCGRFLSLPLQSLGSIPHDPNLVKAVKKQKPVSLLFPNTESARSIEAIAQKLLNIAPPEKKAGLRGFVMRLTGRRGI